MKEVIIHFTAKQNESKKSQTSIHLLGEKVRYVQAFAKGAKGVGCGKELCPLPMGIIIIIIIIMPT